LSVSMVKAWQKENIIPDDCEFRFDRRLIPEEDPEKAAKAVKTFVEKTAQQQGTEVEMEIINQVPGYYTEPTHPWVQLFKQITEKTLDQEFYLGADLGFDDGMYLAQVNIPVITFGALRDGTRYHSHNEFVWLEDLRNCRDVFVALGQLSDDHFTF